ncbi:L,D-transpeptidase family protein [Gallaecimonas mangrovi]|uniref:L,D-transpeptidase family protein n=1 Tax=Gallaecimonas mangrovi TaxID=2291597 RepID=UPI000E20BCAC|nr:L,D-transpeptidase family protein [Gallaecimonas mangrovi]
MRVLLTLLLLSAFPAFATVYPMPAPGNSLLGVPKLYIVKKGDSFEKIARRFDLGPLNIIASNPGIDPLLPPPGSKIKLPSAMLLPNVPHKGIVVNLAELRLYYFDNAAKKVYVFPVGIGRIGLDTPLGATRVVQKIKNPTWTPTQGTRERYAAQGKTLPPVVAAGPNNPLGLFAMRLGFGHGEYLIHGTNEDVGIGMRVSAGCIRMEPQNVEQLFAMVKLHTPVRVINEPVKTAQEANGAIYIEVHSPLTRNGKDDNALKLSSEQLALLSKSYTYDKKVRKALRMQAGIPEMVGYHNLKTAKQEKAP